MDDLFAESYSATRRSYVNGVHQPERESITPLEQVEQCYYRSASPTPDRFLSLHACKGGLSGFIHEDGITWLLEPAMHHLPNRELDAHLMAHRRRMQTMAHNSSSSAFTTFVRQGSNGLDALGLESEPVHHSQLHLLFRAEDVKSEREFGCIVGLTDNEKDEMRRTGKIPRPGARHMHTMSATDTGAESAHQHDDGEGQSSSHETVDFSSSSWPDALLGFRQGRARAMRPMSVVGDALRYIELLVVNDFKRYQLLQEETEQNTAAIAAHMKNTYDATTAFVPPITVILIGQMTWIDGDPYTVAQGQCSACLDNNGVSVDELLPKWQNWRSNPANVPLYPHDAGHLFSGYPFEVPTLGYANVAGMCTRSISGGVESMLNPSDFYNSIIASHELGHNLGMNHDSSGNSCPASGFIMNAILSSPTPTEFSSCSINYEKSWFAAQHPTCMDNHPTQVYGNGTAHCGNGFVEAGEQCDCGSNDCTIRDPCCNGTSCLFMEGATCSSLNPCCDSCSVVPAAAKKVCREAVNSCDLDEVCSGESELCPTDLGYASGTDCDAGAYGPGLCYLNKCFSYLQQCRTVGANFPDAPYDTCPQQSGLNQGSYCSTLWCSADPNSCTFFRRSSGQIYTMDDGVPCPNPDGEMSWQCKSQQCVDPSLLVVNYHWEASGWSDCFSCDQTQYQNVSCIETATNKTINSALCAPSTTPASERLCIKPSIGCYGPEAADGDIVDLFGYVQFSRRTLIFYTLGFFAGFITIMVCCYQAVTYQGENEEPPPLPKADPKSKVGDGAAEAGGKPDPLTQSKHHHHTHSSKRDPNAANFLAQTLEAGFASSSAGMMGMGMGMATDSHTRSGKKKKKRTQHESGGGGANGAGTAPTTPNDPMAGMTSSKKKKKKKQPSTPNA